MTHIRQALSMLAVVTLLSSVSPAQLPRVERALGGRAARQLEDYQVRGTVQFVDRHTGATREAPFVLSVSADRSRLERGEGLRLCQGVFGQWTRADGSRSEARRVWEGLRDVYLLPLFSISRLELFQPQAAGEGVRYGRSAEPGHPAQRARLRRHLPDRRGPLVPGEHHLRGHAAGLQPDSAHRGHHGLRLHGSQQHRRRGGPLAAGAEPVSQIDTDPIGGGAFTTSYFYSWDTANWTPTQSKEVRADGSRHIVDWNPAGDPYQHLRQKESWTDTDGTTVLREVDTIWTSVTSGNGVSQVVVREPASSWEAKIGRVLDSWGREAERTVYNQYELVPGVYNFRAVGGVRRHWNTIGVEYLSLLLQEDTVDFYNSEERVVASTRYQYDQFPLTDRGVVVGQAAGYGPSTTTRGNPTTVRRELLSESRFLETTFTYDTVGNLVQTTDPEGHTTSVGYSAGTHFAYPTSTTNPKGHTTSTAYDFETGLATSTTDANGQTVSYVYDTYNRPLQENYPDGGWTQYFYKDDYFSGKYRSYVRTRRRTEGSLYSQSVDYLDGLGRLVRTRHYPPTGETTILVDREYSICSCSGKTARVSMPYRSGQTPAWTETHYDGIGRITKVIPPDGTPSANHTEYRYGATQIGNFRYRVRAVFDAKGIGTASVTDAAGQLVQVREDANYTTLNSSTVTDYDQRPDAAYSWQYRMRYNPFSDVYETKSVRVSSHHWSEILQGVQARSFKRDSLGRLLEETHPENGTTSYGYDDDGLQVSRTDARGIVTTLSYDSLHRPLTIDYSDATPPAGYVYDQGSFGIGRLREASNANATHTFTYDSRGRIVEQEQLVGGLAFSMHWSYNYAGQPTTVTLPNGTTLGYTHDRMGRLTRVTSDWVDANHPAVMADNFSYHASGTVSSVDWGNGTTTQRSYNSGLQLKNLTFGPQADPDQYLDLEYDYLEGVANTGQIMSITDHNDPGKSIGYTYDRYKRLQTAETQGAYWGLAWTYDRYGNRLSQTTTKGSAPTHAATIHASTNRVSGWTYDAAGNVLNDGEHTYTYDANNMIRTVDGGLYEYRYDAGGQRVTKESQAESLLYVMDAGQYSSVSGWERVYVVVANVRIEYSDGATWFSQTDHLGTPVVETGSDGSVTKNWTAYPFGEQWLSSGASGDQRRYTGHLRDSETSMEYAGARYYQSAAARWTGVDPELGLSGVPQSLNRYTYNLNDPVNYRDPDGRLYELVCVETLVQTGPLKFRVEATCFTREVPGSNGFLPPRAETWEVGGQVRGTVKLFPPLVGGRMKKAQDGLDEARKQYDNPDCKGFIDKLITRSVKQHIGEVPPAELAYFLGVFEQHLNSFTIENNFSDGTRSQYVTADGSTVQDFFRQNEDVAAITTEPSVGSFKIFLSKLFFAQNRRIRGTFVLHELIHTLGQGFGDAALGPLLKDFEGFTYDNEKSESANLQNAFEKFCK